MLRLRDYIALRVQTLQVNRNVLLLHLHQRLGHDSDVSKLNTKDGIEYQRYAKYSRAKQTSPIIRNYLHLLPSGSEEDSAYLQDEDECAAGQQKSFHCFAPNEKN